MNGDQELGEVLRAIGSLEEAVEKLSDDMEKICDFKDELLATRQEFRDYKESRRDLPDQIISLTSRIEHQERESKDLRGLAEATSEEVKLFKIWANKLSGIQIAIGALTFIAVAIVLPIALWWLGVH